jgi:hypothetical protein
VSSNDRARVKAMIAPIPIRQGDRIFPASSEPEAQAEAGPA